VCILNSELRTNPGNFSNRQLVVNRPLLGQASPFNEIDTLCLLSATLIARGNYNHTRNLRSLEVNSRAVEMPTKENARFVVIASL
jgi:hypothetical protein